MNELRTLSYGEYALLVHNNKTFGISGPRDGEKDKMILKAMFGVYMDDPEISPEEFKEEMNSLVGNVIMLCEHYKDDKCTLETGGILAVTDTYREVHCKKNGENCPWR